MTACVLRLLPTLVSAIKKRDISSFVIFGHFQRQGSVRRITYQGRTYGHTCRTSHRASRSQQTTQHQRSTLSRSVFEFYTDFSMYIYNRCINHITYKRDCSVWGFFFACRRARRRIYVPCDKQTKCCTVSYLSIQASRASLLLMRVGYVFALGRRKLGSVICRGVCIRWEGADILLLRLSLHDWSGTMSVSGQSNEDRPGFRFPRRPVRYDIVPSLDKPDYCGSLFLSSLNHV